MLEKNEKEREKSKSEMQKERTHLEGTTRHMDSSRSTYNPLAHTFLSKAIWVKSNKG